jgi:hypothetical protein
MPTDFIAHLIDVGDRVAAPSVRTCSDMSPRIDETVFRASDLQRQSGELIKRVEDRTVLIQDQHETIAFEPYRSWSYQHKLLGLLGRIAAGKKSAAALAASLKDVDFTLLPWTRKEVHDAPDLLALSRGLTDGVFPAPLPEADASAAAGRLDNDPRCVFTASQLQHDYRTALNLALRGCPVVVSRRDVPVGVLERFPTRNRESEFVRHLLEMERFLTAYAMALARNEANSVWTRMTPYPWVAPLTSDGLQEFAAELLPTLLEALCEKEPDLYANNLLAWRAVCDTRHDDRFGAALTSPVQDLGRILIAPPQAPAPARKRSRTT